MKTIKAEAVTAEEAAWPKELGSHVVLMVQYENGARKKHSQILFRLLSLNLKRLMYERLSTI